MSSSNFPGALDSAANLFTLVNGIATTLSAAIDNLVTTINVVDTTSFPSTGYFVIDNEVIQYTGKTGTSFTGCTRGADGTAAASHIINSTVSAFMVADHHNILVSAIIAIQTLLGTNSGHLDLTGRTGFGIKFKSAGGTVVTLTVDDSGNPNWSF